MSSKTDVLIVGAGVIGCACAYYLARDGARVTLIDRGQPGHGCSYGNAGWIVPSHGLPLPMPGAIRHAAKWLLQPDSPLYIKPRPSWTMICWLARFLRCSTHRHLHAAAPALVGLAQESLGLLEAFAKEHGAATISFQQRGLLYVCNSEPGLKHTLADAELVADLGVTVKLLDAEELRAMEPAIRGPVAGGVEYPDDAHAEPLEVVQGFAREAEAAGATIHPATEVISIQHQGNRISAVRTTRGSFAADEYVLAVGAWTPVVARELGLRIPIQAGKGYALTVEPFEPFPSRPMNLVERKIGVTPRDGSLRLAGTLELAGLDESVTLRRVEAIARGASEYLNLPQPVRPIEIWRGLRPCTPDGLPMIGRPEGWSNLILAAGHAMLGLTMSAGTGRLVADICADRTPAVDPEPFQPSRF